MKAPTPEFQLAFLTKIQRLFADGDFTATYKFALLVSIADYAVQYGEDNNEELKIPTRSIGAMARDCGRPVSRSSRRGGCPDPWIGATTSFL